MRSVRELTALFVNGPAEALLQVKTVVNPVRTF